MTTTQLPPHDIEAEEAVVASVMVDAEAWGKVCGILTQWDFFREKNGWIFQACADLTADGIGLNQVTVGHQLARQDRLEELGGLAYLSRVITELPTPVGVEHYAAIVKKDAIYRKAIEKASRLAQTAYNGGGQLQVLFDAFLAAGEELRVQAAGLLGISALDCQPETLADVLDSEDDPLDAVITDGGEGAVLTTDGQGFIVGMAGLGKTNLILRISRGLCEGSYALGYQVPVPRRVLHIALEGSKRGLNRRLRKVWDGADPEAISRYERWKTRLNLAEPADLNRLDIAIQRARPEVLIIDPLRNAHPWDENKSDESAKLMAILDNIIATHHVALILIHHSRKLPQFARHDNGLDALRGSTALAGWVQFVLGISQETGNIRDRFVLVWNKTRDAEEVLEPLVVDFDRSTLDFIIDENAAAGGRVSDDAILTAIFNNGGSMRGKELIEGFVQGAGAGVSKTREAIRALVKVGKLIEFIAPVDAKSRAKTYRLPDDEGLEIR